MTMRRLEGSAAVVVHVGSDLGAGCARRLASEGAEVIVVDPSADIATRVTSAIERQGGVAAPLQAAPGKEEDIGKVAAACAARWGRLDTLVITAAALDWWSQAEDGIAVWEESLRINLLTPIFYSKLLCPLLAQSNNGSIVIYGSIDGLRGNPGLPAYSVARGGLIPFVHVMTDICRPHGIRVNYIAGAAIDPSGPEARTPWGPIADSADILRTTPLGRIATPNDFAGVVTFLASTDSLYVNGAVLVVDGGRLAITPGTSLGQRDGSMQGEERNHSRP